MTVKEDRKAENQAKLEGLQRDLGNKVAALTQSDEWTAWLNVAAKFHRYSFNNQLLLAIQFPEATQVNSYRSWTELGRQVRKGEKSLSIFAPMTRKTEDKTTGEDKTSLVGFRLVPVFDISQTDGDALPVEPLPVLLEGEAPRGLWDALAGIVSDKGYTIERGDCGPANGWTQPHTRTIRVDSELSDLQACKTLAHEVGHMMLHTGEDGDTLTVEHRGLAEVEAESVAYLILAMHGIDSGEYTLPYVAGWSGKDRDKLIKKSAENVVRVARLVSMITVAETLVPA